MVVEEFRKIKVVIVNGPLLHLIESCLFECFIEQRQILFQTIIPQKIIFSTREIKYPGKLPKKYHLGLKLGCEIFSRSLAGTQALDDIWQSTK